MNTTTNPSALVAYGIARGWITVNPPASADELYREKRRQQQRACRERKHRKGN